MSQVIDPLLSPGRLGELYLKNRTLMAPMTRRRAGEDNVPGPHAATYYAQRASAGLIVSEAAQVSPQAVAYPDTPGLHTAPQVLGWRGVTRAVHERDGSIVAQLWHAGRKSLSRFQPDGAPPVAPSPIAAPGLVQTPEGSISYPVPRALDTYEVGLIVDEFTSAARSAKLAGFDGIELHGAHGYLIDQFLRDGSNRRTDRYGGSFVNRSRFLLEILDAVVPIWRGGRVGLRLSLAHESGSHRDSDPVGLARHLARVLAPYDLAYLHIVEAVEGPLHSASQIPVAPVIRQAWKGGLILNGGYDATRARLALLAGKADAISFGTPFVSNPDLPYRFRWSLPLAPVKADSLYGGGREGYIDYPEMGREGSSTQGNIALHA